MSAIEQLARCRNGSEQE